MEKFSKELDHTLELISKNPELFQISKKKKNIRRAIVARFNTLYYRLNKESVEIISFFQADKILIKERFKTAAYIMDTTYI